LAQISVCPDFGLILTEFKLRFCRTFSFNDNWCFLFKKKPFFFLLLLQQDKIAILGKSDIGECGQSLAKWSTLSFSTVWNGSNTRR
jgi:hypothetical protein